MARASNPVYECQGLIYASVTWLCVCVPIIILALALSPECGLRCERIVQLCTASIATVVCAWVANRATEMIYRYDSGQTFNRHKKFKQLRRQRKESAEEEAREKRTESSHDTLNPALDENRADGDETDRHSISILWNDSGDDGTLFSCLYAKQSEIRDDDEPAKLIALLLHRMSVYQLVCSIIGVLDCTRALRGVKMGFVWCKTAGIATHFINLVLVHTQALIAFAIIWHLEAGKEDERVNKGRHANKRTQWVVDAEAALEHNWRPGLYICMLLAAIPMSLNAYGEPQPESDDLHGAMFVCWIPSGRASLQIWCFYLWPFVGFLACAGRILLYYKTSNLHDEKENSKSTWTRVKEGLWDTQIWVWPVSIAGQWSAGFVLRMMINERCDQLGEQSCDANRLTAVHLFLSHANFSILSFYYLLWEKDQPKAEGNQIKWPKEQPGPGSAPMPTDRGGAENLCMTSQHRSDDEVRASSSERGSSERGVV